MSDRRVVIGFDLGGTKMLSGVVDPRTSEILGSKKKKTTAESEEELVTDIRAAIDRSLEKADRSVEDLAGIGIAVPGPVDFEAGVLLETPNIGVKNMPLREDLENVYGVPVLLENDANAGLWGEHVCGAAAGFNHVVGVFPGTGIGGGLILGGELYRGKAGGAGEVGHMTILIDGPLCGCGNRGCLEALASKTAVAREIVQLAARGMAPTVLAQTDCDIRKVKSGVIEAAIANGETAVEEALNKSAEYLGIGLANIVNTFNPELLVLGGGLVEKFGTAYVSRAELVMRSRAMRRLQDQVEIRVTTLGDDAAVLGAAALVQKEMIRP
ncbi:MAG: ROK family protein [Alkalispirochaetaceae bacterium]